MNEEIFVKQKFADWYAANPVGAPEEVSKREFGIGGWGKKIEGRHIALQDERELQAFLAKEAPLFVSYSVARYEFPDARPMPRKNWLGADLVFDLDSDHIKTPCLARHGKGWVCDECLEEIKSQALKLLEDFLIPDFGLKKEEIQVNFSGNRGYHLHVQKSEVLKLDNRARREIVDYIMGNGLDFARIFYLEERALKGPKPGEGGWNGRLAKAFLRSLKEKKLEGLGIHPRTAGRFYEKEEKVAGGIEKGNWDVIRLNDRKVFWKEIAEKLSVKMSDQIDQNVTADSTKLIRLPDSLHGETGLVAKKIKNLGAFNPLKHAVVFDEKKMMKVKVSKAPQFSLLEQSFGPFENQEAEVPEAVAVYLLCKKAAVLA